MSALLKTYLIVIMLFPLSCADSKIKENSIPYFDFYLEYELTNQRSNALIIKSDSNTFMYSVEADNVEIDSPLGLTQPLRERTELSYDEEGEYTITVKIYLEDGTLYASEDLKWVFDSDVNPIPVVSFSEKAARSWWTSVRSGAERAFTTTKSPSIQRRLAR